ncbi:MAG: transglycosylase domain-containing protein, partial [Nitrospinae bacterium]|nr:transglycosylase domain-containing protein [Nitrospinota bacterium]
MIKDRIEELFKSNIKLIVTGTLLAVVLFSLFIYINIRNLPDISSLETYSPSLITELYDDDGKLISQFYIENRILLSQAEIPDSFKKATIAVEDASFYEHGGVNPRGIMRAALRNILA